MNAIARNPTVRLNDDFSYSAASISGGGGGEGGGGGWRIFSTRRSGQNLMSSWSYRRDRAKKRQIFLQTYKLGYVSSENEKLMRSRKLKKVAVKVKSAAVAALAFVRGGALRSCNSRAAIPAASPERVAKFC